MYAKMIDMRLKKITYNCQQCNAKIKSPYTQYTYTGDEIKRVCKKCKNIETHYKRKGL